MAHAYSSTAGKVESLDSLGYSEFQASMSYCETLSQNTKPKSRKTLAARDDQFLLGNLSWRPTSPAFHDRGPVSSTSSSDYH